MIYQTGLDLFDEAPGYDPFPRRDLGWRSYALTRPLLEHTLRRRVEALGNVIVRGDSPVVEIVTSADGGTVTGVRHATAQGMEVAEADLVIDASGHGMPTRDLLRALGFAQPEKTAVGIDIHYATALFTVPPDVMMPWKGIITRNQPPQQTAHGVLMTIEHGQWLVTLIGRGDEKPSDTLAGFLDFAGTLRTRTILEMIRHAELVGRIRRYSIKESVWRHFGKLERFPSRLIPLGDTLCHLNPIYGQGMSMAAFEAELLRRLLDEAAAGDGGGLDTIGQTFREEAERLLHDPWMTSTASEFIYPQTRGERPAEFELGQRLSEALLKLAAEDGDVHRLMAEVTHMIKPANALGDPALVERIVAALAVPS